MGPPSAEAPCDERVVRRRGCRAVVALCCVAAILVVAAPSASGETLDLFYTGGANVYGQPTRGPDGHVWFTTDGGLGVVDFDGRVTLHALPIRANDMTWLARGPDGALWVSHSPGGRLLRVDDTGTVTKIIDVGTLDWPTRFAAGPDGNLWLATDDGLARVTLDGQIAEYRVLPPKTLVWSITAGPDGALWFTWDHGVGRITTSGLTRLWTLTKEGQGPSEIAVGPDGSLWVAGYDEVDVDADDGTLLRITPAGVVTRIKAGQYVSDVAAGPDGNMWFTYDEGVGRVATDGTKLRRWPTPFGGRTDCDGYGALGPDELAFDATGALWTTPSLLSRSLERMTLAAPDRSPLEPFLRRAGVLAAPAAIAAGTDGQVWISGRSAIVRLDADGRRRVYRRDIGRHPGDLLPAADGSLWFAADRGLSRLTEGGSVHRYRGGFGAKSEISTIARGPDGNIWFVDRGRRAIGRMTPAGKVRTFARGLPRRADLRAITADRRYLWVADSSGAVIRVSPSGRIRSFTNVLGPKADPFGIVSGPDGKIWFTEFDAQRIGTISSTGQIREYAVDDDPAAIVRGPDGALWFTTATENELQTTAGVGRITPYGRVDQFYVHSTCIGNARGLTSGPDGKLWFLEPDGPIAVGRLSLQRLVETGALALP